MKTVTSLLVLSSLCFGASLSQPTDSSLIVYNGNHALVHETRDLHLKKDDTFIVYDNVANTIDTDSVNVKLPTGVTLYSQQYRYDKLTLQKLLEAHINKKVLVKISEHKQIKATLLSADGFNVLVKTKKDKIISTTAGNIIFKDIPSSLITKPSLVWNIDVNKTKDDLMQLDYLISNISFQSDYILNIEKNSADLTGWLSVNNHSGKAFENTSLALLAGDVNFANKPIAKKYEAVAAFAKSDTMVQEQSFEGYHYYKIPFKVDIANNEKTQIKFLSLQDMKIERSYIADLQNPLYLYTEQTSGVMQQISFSSLEQPLLQGTVRVYGKLGDETILLGESAISHTPRDTKVDLNIGKEFDLKVIQTIVQRDEQKHSINSKILYTVKNKSKEEKTVTLRIPFTKSNNSKLHSKEKYTYTKGNLVTFVIELKPNTTKQFSVEFERKR